MSEQRERVSVVTGAAQGFGREFAQALGGRGASVVAVDLQRQRLEETVAGMRQQGIDAHAFVADVSDPAAVESLFKFVADRFARVDVLVNNAGIYPTKALDDLTIEDWRRVIGVNMDSAFLCTQAAARLMKERQYGRIINIASSTVFTAPAGFAHYVASKAGIVGFTRAVASELGAHGITVNAIAPALVLTEGALTNPRLVATAQQRLSARPIGREPRPGDLVPALLMLASPDSGFITGQTINVSGGEVKS